MGARNEGAAIILWLSLAIVSFGSPAGVGDPGRPQPLRLTVTHFQDRTQSDEYLWLRESLADQLRALLTAGGMEVVDYRTLEAVGQEQVIADTGLPDPRAVRDVKVAQPEIAITGEYVVDAGTVKLVVTASRIDPPDLLVRLTADSELRAFGDALRNLVPELMRGLKRPPGAAVLEQIKTLELPSFHYQRWYHEGNIYLSAGMSPEAWYCFTQAVNDQPESLDARRKKARALCQMGMYDHAAVELAPACQVLDIRPDSQPAAEHDWDGVSVRERVNWMAWTWLPRWRVDREIRQTLETSLGDPFTEESPLDASITEEVVKLHKNFRRSWWGQYEFTEEDTHADVDLFETLFPHVNHLRRCELFTRYWIAKRRTEQAKKAFLQLQEAWSGIHRILGSTQVDNSHAEAIQAMLQRLRAAIENPLGSRSETQLTYTPRRRPKAPRSQKRRLNTLPDGQEWSSYYFHAWAKEFSLNHGLRGHDGAYLGIGTVTLPTTDDKQRRAFLAYIRAEPGRTWSDPVLLPSPINARSDYSGYPILLAVSDGSYLLGWVSVREDRREQVYVSRTRDLTHWSQPIPTPALGYFDMAELPDGSVAIVSRNTLITRSCDFVTWSSPKLAVTDFNLRMRSKSYFEVLRGEGEGRHPRLVVADDGRVHLLAIVQPGRATANSAEYLIHASSEDGEEWRSSLSRLVTISGSSNLPPMDRRPISTVAAPGGGLVLLLRDHRLPPGDGFTKKEPVYDVIFTRNGERWKRCATIHSDFSVFGEHVPPWGALWRTAANRIYLSMSPQQYSSKCDLFQEVLLSSDLLNSGSAKIPVADPLVFGTLWNESEDERQLCVVVDSTSGKSELEYMANSFGLLVQRDLQMLRGVQPLMAIGLHSGIDIDNGDFAGALRRPRIRWADYVVQFRVLRRNDDSYSVRGRVVNVDSAQSVYDQTFHGVLSEFPDIQKRFSVALAGIFGNEFEDEQARKEFSQHLVHNPRTFVYLSEVALPRPDNPMPPRNRNYVRWAQEVPDAPLLAWFPGLLSDSEGDRRLSEQIKQDRRERRRTGEYVFPDWRRPLNPFNAGTYGITLSRKTQGDTYCDGAWSERFLRRVPECLPLRLATIRAWLHDGIFVRARYHLDYVAQEYEDDPEAVAECARACEYIGDFGKARQLWEMFLRSWPDDDRAWPYWHCETKHDNYDPILIPAAVRLAMAEIRLGVFGKSVDIVREWYEGDETPISDSPAKTLGLALHLHALLATGRAEQAAETAYRQLHLPDKPDGWICYHPATVHYIYALMETGRRTSARNHLSRILNRGYWYRDYHRAFVCPPEPVLREELLRMQLHRPLMGL